METVSQALLLAVDVGPAMVRAGLFDASGALFGSAAGPIAMIRPQAGESVYRMSDIWDAVGDAVRRCVADVPGSGPRVVGMAFDASASLVLAHEGPAPLEHGADVFGWDDRRAGGEAAAINATGDGWIHRLGGNVAADEHLAKLLWLKRQMPEVWRRITAVRDLCDELAWRCTGLEGHGVGALATRWPFDPEAEAGGWHYELLERVGIEDLWTLGVLSDPALPPATTHGRLGIAEAAFFNLPPAIPVAVGLVREQAGLLGVIGRGIRTRARATLALVGGSATRLMALTPAARDIPGVRGPFSDVLLSGFWLHEAGQDCSGAALDSVLAQHPGGPMSANAAMHAAVAAEILELMQREGPAFAAQRHVVPDWLGNRSPMADDRLRALQTGIGDESGRRAFLEAYFATARGLVLQARQIISHMNRHGYAITRVAISGDYAESPLLLRLCRDGLGVGVVQTSGGDPVLRGTAMVAAVAAGLHPDLFVAVDVMTPPQMTWHADPLWRRAHEAAYRIFHKLHDLRNVVARESRAMQRLGATETVT